VGSGRLRAVETSELCSVPLRDLHFVDRLPPTSIVAGPRLVVVTVGKLLSSRARGDPFLPIADALTDGGAEGFCRLIDGELLELWEGRGSDERLAVLAGPLLPVDAGVLSGRHHAGRTSARRRAAYEKKYHEEEERPSEGWIYQMIHGGETRARLKRGDNLALFDRKKTE